MVQGRSRHQNRARYIVSFVVLSVAQAAPVTLIGTVSQSVGPAAGTPAAASSHVSASHERAVLPRHFHNSSGAAGLLVPRAAVSRAPTSAPPGGRTCFAAHVLQSHGQRFSRAHLKVAANRRVRARPLVPRAAVLARASRSRRRRRRRSTTSSSRPNSREPKKVAVLRRVRAVPSSRSRAPTSASRGGRAPPRSRTFPRSARKGA